MTTATLSDLAPPSSGADQPIPETKSASVSLNDIAPPAEEVAAGGGKSFTQRFLTKTFERRPEMSAVPYKQNIISGALGGAGLAAGAEALGAGLETVAPMTGPYAPAVAGAGALLQAGAGLSGAARVSGIASNIAMSALGGAGASAAGSFGEQRGFSPVEQFAAELAGGMGTQGIAKAIPRVGGMAADFVLRPRYALGKLVSGKTNVEKMAEATQLKDKVFGKPDPNFDPTQPSIQATSALRDKYIAQDPTFAAANRQTGVNPSQYYRDKLFGDVNSLMQSGQRFSQSPEFAQLSKKIGNLVEAKKISPQDAGPNLLDKLMVDRSPNPEVTKIYPEIVHDTVRQWQAPINAEGIKSIDAATERSIKREMQDAYNKWLTRNGLGAAEQSLKKIEQEQIFATTRDRAQTILSRYVPGEWKMSEELSKLARDSDAKPVVMDAFKKHLANTPTNEIPSEFQRLDRLLVSGGVLGFKQVQPLRDQANQIELAIKNGVDEKRIVSLRNSFIRNLGNAMVSSATVKGSDNASTNP